MHRQAPEDSKLARQGPGRSSRACRPLACLRYRCLGPSSRASPARWQSPPGAAVHARQPGAPRPLAALSCSARAWHSFGEQLFAIKAHKHVQRHKVLLRPLSSAGTSTYHLQTPPATQLRNCSLSVTDQPAKPLPPLCSTTSNSCPAQVQQAVARAANLHLSGQLIALAALDRLVQLLEQSGRLLWLRHLVRPGRAAGRELQS
jgi:hypothetical protein